MYRADQENARSLTVKSDHGNSFTIVQFTDLHFGEHDESDNKSITVMKSVLDNEPETDLVVFGGDQVSGYVLYDSKEVSVKWLESIKTVADLHIPFVTIFGNHDDQPFVTIPLSWRRWVVPLLLVNLTALICSMVIPRYRRFCWIAITSSIPVLWMFIVGYPSSVMRRTLMHYEQAHFTPYSQSRELNGLSNYYIPITNGNKTALVFLLDSGGGRLYEGYTDNQIKWVQTVSSLYPGTVSIAFAHIPSFEFENPADDWCFGNEFTEPGEFTGWESMIPMRSLAASGVKAAFFGHNHKNSHCCMPQQDDKFTHSMPVMCYGRHTGYGGYGNWTRGARVIQLNFSSDQEGGIAISTWLRMEDQTKRATAVIFPFS
jgi:hypothetical protein